MKILNQSPRQFVIICLYDPYSIELVSLDDIRKKGVFNTLTSVEDEFLIFESSQKKVRVTFQTTRLEYVDENTNNFEERDLNLFRELILNLPQLKIKAIGVNFLLQLMLNEGLKAGEFIRDRFLSNQDSFESKLGKPIISHSIRTFYGSPEDHYDLRLTPIKLIGNELGVQLHLHRDIQVTEHERLVAKITSLFSEGNEELRRLINQLFQD